MSAKAMLESIPVKPKMMLGKANLLVCSSKCSVTYIWYKNGHPLSNTSQNLQFSANSEDAGSYSCAATSHKDLPSSAITLDVRYAPKNTSVSVSPSAEIVKDNSVTLTCSSNANPPVHSYTWFKDNIALPSERSQQTYTIRYAMSWHTGDYSPDFIWYKNGHPVSNTKQILQFSASSADAGSYSCAVTYHEDLPSSAVTLNVKYSPKNTSVSVSPSGEIVEGSSVTLTCSSNANPLVQNYTWFKDNTGVTSVRRSGQNYSITNISSEDSGQYHCEAKNNLGSVNSTAVSIDVQYSPKSASVSVSPSGEIVEGSSVTLNCSSNANPPVQSYTWFKKNDTGVWQTGSGQSLTFANIRSWNSGQYYCEAKNKIGAHNSTTQMIRVQGK
ncbi:B-cell receptor CD22-like [Megalops cyprinoides]|uniref:B-cell receptor CD22-like n=1 Tax=Megalops cyprinoides TaxID=118141 RepID=UPI001864C5E6|nr:B-cell receptor CD22-like [Megalops cyprinoides]